MRKLWNDESGAVISAELVLLMTLLVIGVIVGLKALGSAVVTELGDVAAAVGSADQSYYWSGTKGRCSASAGTKWHDGRDTGDQGPWQPWGGSQGIRVCGLHPRGE